MENTTPTVVPSVTKFSAEETKEITDIRDGFEQAVIAFGKFYLQKKELDKLEDQLNIEYKKLEDQEKSFLDRIVSKYGEGSYDPTTGIFTPNKKA